MIAQSTPIFVVSSGRCGSTLLSEVLALHPDILSLSEVFMSINTQAFAHRAMDGRKFWGLFARPNKALSRTLTPETSPVEFQFDFSKSERFTIETLPPILFMTLPRLSDEPERLFRELGAAITPRPRAPLAAHYSFMFEWLCQRLNKKIWVERSGASLIFVDALYRMYPSAKFIHLYRDGRDVALSMREFPPIGLLAQSWSDAKKFGINLLKPPFRLGESPYVAAAAKLSGLVERVAVRLDRKAEIGVAGEFWSAMVSVGLESLSKVPAAQKFDIRYEDLIATPGETLRDLIQFIEPDLLDDDWVDAARSIVGPNRSRRGFLTAADAALLDFACAPGLKALGYNEPPLPGEAPARNQSHASITAPIDT